MLDDIRRKIIRSDNRFFFRLDRSCVRLAILALFVGFAGRARAAEISLAGLLDDMTNLTAMAEFPDPPYVTRQFSSYDRAKTTPADPMTWFANSDLGNYLRVEQRGGRTEFVMADMQGPGAIVRIWTPNPIGTLRIYLDGKETPSLAAPMEDLLSGKYPLLPRPIAAETSTGRSLYLPIPYAKGCKVTCDKGAGVYYHVNYRTYPRGTAVKTFTLPQLEAAQPEIRKLALHLAAPRTASPLPDELARKNFQKVIEPGQTAVVTRFSGPQAVASLAARVDLPKAQVEAALRALVIQISFDGRQTVEAPLGDFFGAAPGINPFQSLPLGVNADGSMYCHWVMPFQETMEIRLVNHGRIAVPVAGSVAAMPWNWTKASMYFHARWKIDYAIPTRPMQDWNYLTAKGKGVFGGVAFFLDNPVRDWWGEGDEKIYVDGEPFPSHMGTGTEDYYGYGWGCTQLFTHAYHAQTRCDGPDNFGRTSLNRFDILDRIPFTTSFKFDMEIWHWRDCKVNLAVLAYYYGLPGADDTFPPIVPEKLVLRPVVLDRNADAGPRKPIVWPGVIEGEAMRILKSTGKPSVQSLGGDSGGENLWWHGGEKPGDELLLGFDAPKAGRYRVFGRFLKAVDYGIMQLAVNGKKTGEPIDFFNGSVIRTAEVPLGTFELRQGPNELSAVVVGANPKAQKEYMFGLDYIRIKPESRSK